jgi:gliding motility-associated-like protein
MPRPDSVLCQGEPFTFVSASSAPNSTITQYLWDFGDGTPPSSQFEPVKTYAEAGVYTVKLTVENSQGCAADTVKTVTVHIQPDIRISPNYVVPEGTMLQFHATTNSNTFSYLWSPAGMSDNTVLNPIYLANNDATFTLVTTGEGGCIDTDVITIKVLRPVNMTNAFSPNGDGINETWLLDNLRDYPGVVVNIFNRYGQVVFNSIGYSNPWDGTMKGKPLPVGTYYYVIDLKNGFKPLNGSVTIIR